eukprot:COSAG02_NODE_34351_length_485_cov_1.134715_1_plen_95_part_10
MDGVTSVDFDQVSLEVLSDINETGPRLDLQNLQLRVIPPLVLQKTVIEELILAHNSLSVVPADISNLTSQPRRNRPHMRKSRRARLSHLLAHLHT